MRNQGILAGTLFLAYAWTGWAQEQDSPQGIVNRAIKAHGGAKRLIKNRSIRFKSTGILDFKGKNGEIKLQFSAETFAQPGKFKHVVQTTENNEDLTVIPKPFPAGQAFT